MFLAQALREQGDAPGAIREIERVLELDAENPSAIWRAARAIHGFGATSPKARQAMERVDAKDRSNYQGRLHWALLLALEGKKTEALREMDEHNPELCRKPPTLVPLQPAEVYAVLGDTGKALDWLDRAVAGG